MAVPELGQLKIIPDLFTYHIGKGFVMTSSMTVVVGSVYSLFDHRVGTQCEFDTNTSSSGFTVYSTSGESGKFMCIVDGHDLNARGGGIGFLDSGGGVVTGGVEAVFNGVIRGGGYYCDPSDNNMFAFHTTTTELIKGVAFAPTTNWGADVTTGIIHLGIEYELPTNSTVSLSYDRRHFNKVNTTISGASYSTLYNINSQRIIKASWEYINWESGSGSAVLDFSLMTNICFGSHVPVALQLSQTGSVASDYFMFARITKWNQTQMSPSLWKVSAEFTEFI